MKFWESGKLHERLNVGLTGVIALFTIINVIATIVYVCTVWKASREASIQTDKIIGAANIQSGAASKIAESAHEFSVTASGIKQDTTNAVDQFRHLAQSSENSIKAAQKSAQSALDASIQASTLDERPWITFSRFTLSSEAQEGKDFTFTVNIGIDNTGKTPALDTIPSSKVSSWTKGQMPPIMEQLLPTPVSRGIIAPGSNRNSFRTAPLTVPANHISAYISGQNLIYVQAKVGYRDVNNIQHWTTLCAAHPYGASLDEFNYCEQGNEADNNKK